MPDYVRDVLLHLRANYILSPSVLTTDKKTLKTTVNVEKVLSNLPLTNIVGKTVVWDQRKSRPNRGDMWAACPFCRVKGPPQPFFANDNKGIYYCFECKTRGDVIDFIAQTNKITRMEALDKLLNMKLDLNHIIRFIIKLKDLKLILIWLFNSKEKLNNYHLSSCSWRLS